MFRDRPPRKKLPSVTAPPACSCPLSLLLPAAAAPARPLVGLAGWRYRWLRQAAAIAGELPAARRPDDFWLRPDSLAAAQDGLRDVRTGVVVLTEADTGRRVLLTTQTFRFRPAAQVSAGAGGGRSGLDLRRRLLAPLSFRVLALGQLLTSGDYGQDGLRDLDAASAAALVRAVGATLARRRGYLAVLVKDLAPPGSGLAQALEEAGYFPLPVEPVMELALRPHWRSVDDYLADLSSKYRVRYRRARSHLGGLTRREFTAAEVRRRAGELYALYRRTSGRADFNLTELTPQYFRQLAGRATVRAYFDGERLVGFTSEIANGGVLHAHYLGMEDRYQRSHHLYHNMLCDLLESAIAGGFSRLDYGRTATEIKSSLGAEPVHYATQLRARLPLLNWLVPRFVPAIFRQPEWTPRRPFRNPAT